MGKFQNVPPMAARDDQRDPNLVGFWVSVSTVEAIHCELKLGLIGHSLEVCRSSVDAGHLVIGTTECGIVPLVSAGVRDAIKGW